MNPRLRPVTISLLRWVLGLVVILQSCEFLLSASVAHFFITMGLPRWVQPALGGAEIVATSLFLLPLTTIAGGYLLLTVFAFAAAIHILHGQYDVAGLVVYAMAVLVCMAHHESTSRKTLHDG